MFQASEFHFAVVSGISNFNVNSILKNIYVCTRSLLHNCLHTDLGQRCCNLVLGTVVSVASRAA